MKQVKVLSVTGNCVMTTDGVKYPIGRRVFQPGDYAYVEGQAIFGHEMANGTPSVEIDGIPVLQLSSGYVYEYGYIPSEQYKFKSNAAAVSSSPRRAFVNSKNAAFALSPNPLDKRGDLIAAETASGVNAEYIVDVEVSTDETLLAIESNEIGHYYRDSRSNPHDAPAISQEDARIDIYNGGEKSASLGGLLNSLAADVKANELASHPQYDAPSQCYSYPSYIKENTWVPMVGRVNRDGTYSISGRGRIVGMQYYPVWYDYYDEEGTHIYVYGGIHMTWEKYYFWTLENGEISYSLAFENLNWDAGAETFSRFPPPPEKIRRSVLTRYRFALNDGYYLIYKFSMEQGGNGIQIDTDTVQYAIYTPGENLLVTFGTDRAYGIAHCCVAQTKTGNYLIKIGSEILLVDAKTLALSTVIPYSSTQNILNTRLVRTRKIFRINTALQSLAGQI